MKTIILNGKKLKLRKEDFVAKGGEGEIYRKGNLAFKFPFNVSTSLNPAKIRELSVLANNPNILAPTEIVTDTSGVEIGFTMPFKEDTISLATLFSKDFQVQNSISVQDKVKILKTLQTAIEFIHANKCLMVDGNEMNYLISKGDLETPYIIDVDSFQTEHFPYTAFHEQTRDYATPKVSPLTDWYSFSIVAFKLFFNTHPYRGNHPGFKRSDIIGKMKAGISVFHSEVKLPPTLKSLSGIPSNYLEWFKDLYSSGKRLAPPGIAGSVQKVTIQVAAVKSSSKLKLVLIKTYKFTILKFSKIGSADFAVLKNSNVTGLSIRAFLNSEISKFPILSEIKKGKAHLSTNKSPITPPILDTLQGQLVTGRQLFYITKSKIIHIELLTLSGKTFASCGVHWDILPNSSQLLDGVIYQSTLGKPYLYIPYTSQEHKDAACAIVSIQELEGIKVLAGKRIDNIVIIAGNDGTNYVKFIFKFKSDFSDYTVIKTTPQDFPSLNFTVLDTGVFIHINEELELEAMPSHWQKSTITKVSDKSLTSNMQLFTADGKALVSAGNKLYQLSMVT